MGKREMEPMEEIPLYNYLEKKLSSPFTSKWFSSTHPIPSKSVSGVTV